jgi:hypothetical protein
MGTTTLYHQLPARIRQSPVRVALNNQRRIGAGASTLTRQTWSVVPVWAAGQVAQAAILTVQQASSSSNLMIHLTKFPNCVAWDHSKSLIVPNKTQTRIEKSVLAACVSTYRLCLSWEESHSCHGGHSAGLDTCRPNLTGFSGKSASCSPASVACMARDPPFCQTIMQFSLGAVWLEPP